jgi:predicted deacylase
MKAYVLWGAVAIVAGLLAVAFTRSLSNRPIAPANVPAVATSTHTVIGTSVEGRPIDAYTYGTGATHLFFVGGMHGGYEWNAALLAYDLKQYLDTDPSAVPEDLTVAIVPELNVDGLVKVVGKEGPFTVADVNTQETVQVAGRTNADAVDLNRNFDCNWKPEATWRNEPESAGTAAFSEPESKALRAFIASFKPSVVVFWHSQSGTVYAAQCGKAMAPHELDIMRTYASAAGYKTQATFDAYPVAGDSEGWLASIGIPALTVELSTHKDIEWEQNLAGVQALFEYFSTSTASR